MMFSLPKIQAQQPDSNSSMPITHLKKKGVGQQYENKDFTSKGLSEKVKQRRSSETSEVEDKLSESNFVRIRTKKGYFYRNNEYIKS